MSGLGFGFGFEAPPQMVNEQERSAEVIKMANELFESTVGLRLTLGDRRTNTVLAGNQTGNMVIKMHGAIRQFDLPRGFEPEQSGPPGLGGVDARTYHLAGDFNTSIVSTRRQGGQLTDAVVADFESLLAAGKGPISGASLSEKQRAQLEVILGSNKFGDNQFAPGRSENGYGDDWKAPSHYIRSLEVREYNGKRMLFVDGARVRAPWTPRDGLDKSQARFTAVFIIDQTTPGQKGIQSLFLEAPPAQYANQQNKFLRALQSATFA